MQLGWPLGMPIVRKLDADLWELRVHIKDGIARVLFTVEQNEAVLLHAFVKKSRKAPGDELSTARRRLDLLRAARLP
jgi:phage-related protein